MITILETLHAEGFDNIERPNNLVTRELAFSEVENAINIAIGMRRTGKTHFLYQTVKQLLASGVAKQQILIINFEDERLLPMSAKEMGALLDDFYRVYPENHDRCCYLFLDEVQNIPDWQLVVRRFFDSKQVRLFLTGSSAKLLSKEIATSLRGRSLSLEVWPFSFKEFCASHDYSFPQAPLGQKAFDILRGYLVEYFVIGGFPGVQHLEKDDRLSTLQSYVDVVILRDIIERHNVSNIALLKYLCSSLLKNAATSFSVNKFFNDVKSQGYKIGKETLHTYLDYIEDSFLVFTVPFYSESERVRQTQPKKIYAIDSGLVKAYSIETRDTFNQCFENLIYLDLRRQNKNIYFYRTRDGFEVDFVTVANDGSRELIQVTWDMSERATADREQRALKQAEQELGIKGRIITMESYLREQVQK